MAMPGKNYRDLLSQIADGQYWLSQGQPPRTVFFTLLLSGDATAEEQATNAFFSAHWPELDRLFSASHVRVYAIAPESFAADHGPSSRDDVYEAARQLGVPTAALPALVCFAQPWHADEVRYLRLGDFNALDQASHMRLWRALTDIVARAAQAPAPRRRRLHRGPAEDAQLAAIANAWDALQAPGQDRLDAAARVSDKVASTAAAGATVAEALARTAGAAAAGLT